MGSVINDDALLEVKIGRMRNKRDRHDRTARDFIGDRVDRNMSHKNLKSYDDGLIFIEFAYNETMHSTTSYTSFEIIYVLIY